MDLTEEDLFKITQEKSKASILEMIKSQMVLPKMKTESDFWRVEIELEMCHELIDLCLRKGFSLPEILECLSIQRSILDTLRNNSQFLNLTQFTRRFYELLSNVASNRVSGKHMMEFIEFQVEAILKHFNLLRYVLTTERANCVKQETKLVYGPSQSEYDEKNMKNSKSYEQWQSEQKLKELEDCESRLKEKFLEQEKRLLDEEKSTRNLISFIKNDAFGDDRPLDEKTVQELIYQVSEPIVHVTEKSLRLEADYLKEKANLSRKIQEQLKQNDQEHSQRKLSRANQSPKTKKK